MASIPGPALQKKELELPPVSDLLNQGICCVALKVAGLAIGYYFSNGLIDRFIGQGLSCIGACGLVDLVLQISGVYLERAVPDEYLGESLKTTVATMKYGLMILVSLATFHVFYGLGAVSILFISGYAAFRYSSLRSPEQSPSS